MYMLPQIKPSKKPIYLDHAATTYLRPEVEKIMGPFWHNRFGNPASLYKQGRDASGAVEKARTTVANLLNARPNEIVFTAGGTESINLAIFGVARQYELTHKKKGHLIASTIEHHAVLRSLEALKEEGWDFTLIDVDSEGIIKISDLKKAIRKDTILVSIMYANNEIGAIEPVAEIGKWLKQLNGARALVKLPKIIFHTDACQAGGSLDLNVQKLNVDLMTINASKVYGPKQMGLLYIKTGTPIRPLIFGGGQERDMRSGTENVAGIVGLAEALRLAQEEKDKENTRLAKLRDYFTAQLIEKIPSLPLKIPRASLNGPTKRRLPNNINIIIPGIEGESLLIYLDAYNIAISTGSACATTSLDPSHVLVALGLTPEPARSSVRFTLGKQTTKADIDYVLQVLPGVVEELRRVQND